MPSSSLTVLSNPSVDVVLRFLSPRLHPLFPLLTEDLLTLG
jgi:hypothetical protein